METHLIEFRQHSDRRGCLVSLEELKDVPFPIRRVFYIYGVPYLEKRGGHAHRTCQQMLVAMAGEVLIYAGEQAFLLDCPTKGLFVPPGVKVTMANFSADCILLVLCSEHYDPFDYIFSEVHRLEAPVWIGA